MFGAISRLRQLLSIVSVVTVFVTFFSPISSSSADQGLVTCVNLQTGNERISHTGSCRYTQEAQANWRRISTDSLIASGSSAKFITICSNKENSAVSYQVIRSKCAKHQVTTIFSRSGSLPATPVIAEAVSFDYNSASLKLAKDPATNADAPIAFYTITSTTVETRTPIVTQSQRVYYWKDLSIAINTLQASTRYTFTVSATTADGTSQVSISSIPLTTPAYVSPASSSSSNAPSLAAPAFTLSSTSETKTVNNAITGYTISSTGGTISSFAISPAAPAGTTFNTSTGLLSGTPTSVAGATAYTITANNASGSVTKTFTLTVSSAPPAVPAFTLSSNSETRVVTTSLVGYTISSTGGAIDSYALTGTLPAGLAFSTSTGLITGIPTETRTATTFTITGTNVSGSATATYRLRVTGDVGDTGPGGGIIYYYQAAGFNCGPSFTATGSPTGGKCKYLEAAPSGWELGGEDPALTWAQHAPIKYDTATVGSSGGDTAIATAIGSGFRNTRAIVAQGNTDPATSAAALADSYTATISSVTYDDWFLPSKDELGQLYLQKETVGGFKLYNYWSSTELNASNAWYQDFNAGGQYDIVKNFNTCVRPVRAF